MSRNMPLPEVKAPFGVAGCVVSSIHSTTGLLAVCNVPRTIGGSCYYSAPVDVTVQGTDSSKLIGVFGDFKSLTVTYPESIEGKRIFAQDMSADEAEDITAEVKIEGNSLTIFGDTIHRVGLTIQECPTEIPGMAVKII